MRKFLLLILCFAAYNVQAQVCTPGAQTSTAKGYILPDSATNLVHGCAGFDYNQIMYIKAPKDTTFNITFGGISGVVNADIDSFVIASNITGLPSYLSVNSVPAPLLPAGASSPKSNYERLRVPGDSLACVKISGTVPTGTAAGTTNLNIAVLAYLSNLSSPNATLDALLGFAYPNGKLDTVVNLNYYTIVIDPQPCYPQSVNDMAQYGFHLVACMPNPFTQQASIQFESAEAAAMEFRVLNAFGQVVFQKNIRAQKGLNYLPVEAMHWSTGIYTCLLSNTKHTASLKIIMQ